MNLAQIVATSAGQWPSRPAVADLDAPGGRRTLTYAALADDVARRAQGLADRGLVTGDRVALLLSNGVEYLQSFFAIAWAGMVSVPLNVRLLERELLHMIEDSGARLLIVDDRFAEAYPSLVRIPKLGTLIVKRSGITVHGAPFESLAATRAMELVHAGDDDLASLMYTSGTTGLPKGVMLPHRSWTAVSTCLRRELAMQPGEVTLHTAALTHGSGFMVLPTFSVGGVNMICNRFDPVRTLSLYRDEGVNGGFMVPSMIRMLLDADPAPIRSQLRNLYYAGSPIDEVTLRGALAKFGPVLIQSFAQMEVPMVLTMLDRGTHERAAAGDRAHLVRSAGKVLPGVEVRIVDDDDRDVARGEVGEIVARAPQTMIGYWNRPEATADALRGGWLHTGDLGRFDADGFLYVVDRKKDMIISGGSNVYAREVEEALLEVEGLRDVAVIGLPHRKWGEMVTAVLVADSKPPS